ncbi:MAG: IS21 family transposase [Rhodobiaceae bacterium]|nr:IS21 family transposase [Deltaproteobacteria bacterium]MCC0017450.1 IS21 family transposase [Rhodobiaceae bacterium]
MVTDEQVRLLRRLRMDGKTQEQAAARAGMSVRSARSWERAGALPSQVRTSRTWRTRPDPFAEVWDDRVVPLLQSDRRGKLQAKTVLEVLAEEFPDQFGEGQLRTLQRRIRDWRALHGGDKEVFFEQDHHPGQQASVDFSHCDELNVTIGGEPLRHLLFQFRLAFSGWVWVMLAFGETFEALISGIQGALWALGGRPVGLVSDNLSAATHELRRGGGRALNARFADFLGHLGCELRRIRPGKSNENGIVEKGHDLAKKAVEQALIVRGSRDFANQAQYESFVRQTLDRKLNAPRQTLFEQERPHLLALPASPYPTYTRFSATVRKWSTIRVGGRGYSVPSRLIGHTVQARQYANHIEVYYNDRLVESFPRIRGEQTTRIDYRHIIGSLVRKPGAFANYRFRQELFPTLTFRLAYDALRGWRGERADVEYVRILHLAAMNTEAGVDRALASLLAIGERFDYAAVQAAVAPPTATVPQLSIGTPDLIPYDRMIEGGR